MCQLAIMNVEQRTLDKIVEATDKAYTIINKCKINGKSLILPKLF